MLIHGKGGSFRSPQSLGVVFGALFVSACATTAPPATSAIAKVNPASIAAAPAAWDGRAVEVVGLAVWEDGAFGLYQDYGTYCRAAENAAIYVHWAEWPGVAKKDSRRRVVVRGIFRNRLGAVQPDGKRLTLAAAPGPGPLEPGSVVRWLSPPQRPCPNRS
jgi:hypothetical protein